MSKNPVGLVILWWGETIVSLRILLFAIPVMINKYSAGSLSLSSADNCFIVLLALTALIYFVVGILSISGAAFWRAAHYAAVVVVILLTGGTIYLSGRPLAETESYFSLPLIFSLAIVALAGILGKGKKAA